VMNHSFHDITDKSGRVSIKGLAPGKYTVAAWHQKRKPKILTQEVEIKADGEVKDVNFTYAK